ncbi:FAD-dependent oxidoreductase [Komagataeibacter rhaeticus]|nr:FAD-dependent oxidoreductase [Komagataeibacter rhaeticus]
MTRHPGTAADTIVIGGGMVGASIALGLVLRGHRVTVLDEGDRALRAARANSALLWVQSKGRARPPILTGAVWPLPHGQILPGNWRP